MPSSEEQSSVEVSLKNLSPGMILADPAKDPETNESLLPEGTQLTEQKIRSLKRRDVFVVYVEEESYESHVDENGEVTGIDFDQEELEDLAEEVLHDHKQQKKEREEERREFYQDTINFVRVMFDDIKSNRMMAVDDLRTKVKEMAEMLSEQKEEMIKMTRIRNNHNYLLSHTVNMTFLAIHLARELDFSRKEMIELGVGCLLHDVGMMKIPDSVLEKEQALSDKEYKLIQNHPRFKNDLLKKTDGVSYLARSVVLQHHERMDGSGYPQGLENGRISKLARVAAVVDSYEAMISPRVYRDRKTSYEAMQILIQEAGKKYWEKAARNFYQSMAIYPIGSVVELNTGEVGVVHKATGAPMRPKIKILVDQNGNNPEPPPLINMVEEQKYFINDVLNEVDV